MSYKMRTRWVWVFRRVACSNSSRFFDSASDSSHSARRLMSSVRPYNALGPAARRAEKSPWRIRDAQPAMPRIGATNARRLTANSAATNASAAAPAAKSAAHARPRPPRHSHQPAAASSSSSAASASSSASIRRSGSWLCGLRSGLLMRIVTTAPEPPALWLRRTRGTRRCPPCRCGPARARPRG